jgi:hypothetical protein
MQLTHKHLSAGAGQHGTHDRRAMERMSARSEPYTVLELFTALGQDPISSGHLNLVAIDDDMRRSVGSKMLE